MKKSAIFFLVSISLMCLSCKNSKVKTEQEIDKPTKEIIDSTYDGWRAYNQAQFPDTGWHIEGGILTCEAKGGGGDIIFDKILQDFELSLEWKIAKGGNSGVFYHAVEIPGKPIYFSAPEIQLLDNENHSNGKVERQRAGSLFDILPADPQNANPFGEWNKLKVIVKDNLVTHYQNDVKVASYSIAPDDWKALTKGSKFESWEPFVNKAPKGYIGLQDHGDEVSFRKIQIQEL